MSAEEAVPPCVMWAQRANAVLLTICLEDCKSPDITFETEKVHFVGVGGTDMKKHEVTLNLCKEIDPEKSMKFVRDRNIELILKKKDEGFWPQLMKDKKKYHWLKVDFNKWKDEDDSDDEMGGGGGGQGEDIEEMMRQMGGLGGGVGGGAGDIKHSLDDLDGETDSDDEELPDLE